MTNKTDWADERHYEMLVEQRKHFWLPDTVRQLARWMGMKQGMSVLDLGCGLGYLGYTYWRYFGKGGGSYIGMDINRKLLDDAEHASRKWARGGTADFHCADACDVPLPEATADIVMCQTLLLHLAEPEKALAEMVRLVKPGGFVVCMEPDYLSSELTRNQSSYPDTPVDIFLLMTLTTMQRYYGRIKLGKGDKAMGGKLACLLAKAGLVDVDIRLNDIVIHLEPPYATAEQQNRLARIKQSLLCFAEENHQPQVNEEHDEDMEELIAGGGKQEDYELVKAFSQRQLPELSNQLLNDQFWSCGGGNFYIAKGRKP